MFAFHARHVGPRGEPRLELGVELFWNSLDKDLSSIVFYLEMKVQVEVGVHDIRPRFTPRVGPPSLLPLSSYPFVTQV